MKRLNELLQELGISKVKLAKYLGVSRQMVYNYLVLDSLDKWPKEKKLLLLQLLDIPHGTEEELNNIVINTDYLLSVEQKLNSTIQNTNDCNNILDLNDLNKNEKALIKNIVDVLKDLIIDEKDEGGEDVVKYLYYLLQSIKNVPEIKYFLGYMAKINGFIKPEEYVFDEKKQYMFESILYTAITLYYTGGASKSKLIEKHNQFIQEIESKKEERLGRTAQLNTIAVQALKELA